jgi:hypothetical protein
VHTLYSRDMPLADGVDDDDGGGGADGRPPRPNFRIELSARENSGLDDDVLPSVSTQNSTLGSSLSLPTQRSTAMDELPVLLPLRHEMCITSEPRFITNNRPWYGPCERRVPAAGASKNVFRPNGIMKKLQRDRSSESGR